jgi:polar amino acid transport system substrate-binding protein
MSPNTAPEDRPFRKAAWLTALGIAALCAAVFVAIESRAAAAAPLPVSVLRIGIAPTTLPVSTGERDYTNGGFDAVYAQALARQLGVEARLVPLPHGAQAQALRQGEVDLVLTRPDTAAPPEVGLRVLGTGYASGLSVAMRSDTDVRAWKDLAGRVVCTTAENQRAQEQAAQVRGRLKVFDAPAQALLQVRTGECAAAILDRSQLEPLLAQKEWLKFSATLPATSASPLQAWLAEGRSDLAAPIRAAMLEIGTTEHWAQRRQKWAANVAFEVYFDQTGPDCH